MSIATKIDNLRQLPPEQLLGQATAVLPPWVAAILVIALAWKLVELTWLLVPQGDANMVAPPTAAASLPNRPAPRDGVARSIDTITRAHVFGQAPRVGEVAPRSTPQQDLENVDETSLKWTLHGTIATEQSEVSRALIEDDRGDAAVYSVDEAIARGVSLFAVYPDHVILDRSGTKEKLSLREIADLAGAPPRRRSASSSRASPSRSTRASRTLTEALSANPQKLTDLIRPQPVFADGKQIGYRVYPGRKRQEFVKLGLKPGDLVTQINGTALDDPSRGLEIFRTLEDQTQVSVTVERNGQAQIITLDTAALNESVRDR